MLTLMDAYLFRFQPKSWRKNQWLKDKGKISSSVVYAANSWEW
jgi:hypothetical protein